jgi:tetratricopeptide (TPR) repeat protein
MRVLCVLLSLIAFSARAQSPEVRKYLNAATTLYENLEYEKALKQLKKARSRAAGPDDEAKVGLLEGIVLVDLGKEQDALTAFKTAFSIDLEAKLPLEVSPKVQAVAERARESVRKLLAPQLEAQRLEEERVKAEAQQRAEAAARAEAELKRQEDEERLRRTAPPLAVVKPAAPSVRSYAWIPMALGVASAGVAGGLLIDARGKYDGLMNGTAEPERALAMRDTGKTHATLGAVFIGLAGAGVATAAVMYLLGAQPGAQVAVAPLPGGGFAAVSFPLDLGGAR